VTVRVLNESLVHYLSEFGANQLRLSRSMLIWLEQSEQCSSGTQGPMFL
jgi:hypothetical protein